MSINFSLRMKKSVRHIFFVCLIFILQLYLPQFIVDANAGQVNDCHLCRTWRLHFNGK